MNICYLYLASTRVPTSAQHQFNDLQFFRDHYFLCHSKLDNSFVSIHCLILAVQSNIHFSNVSLMVIFFERNQDSGKICNIFAYYLSIWACRVARWIACVRFTSNFNSFKGRSDSNNLRNNLMTDSINGIINVIRLRILYRYSPMCSLLL